MATDGEDTTAAAPPATIATVNVKLPPFWPADPEVWFAQCEALFNTKKITFQKAKFNHVIASLSSEVATEVRDLILKPPEESPYDTLRKQLIKRTAPPEQRRLQQLFNAGDLGDRKPTQMLRHMQQLLGERAGSMDNTFLKELFLQKLPANIKMVLTTAPTDASLEELAELADRVADVAAPAVEAAAPSKQTNELEQLRAEVAKLQASLKSFSMSRRNKGTRSHSPQASEDTICWYHKRFGKAATKCTAPCSMASQENDQASH